MTHIHISEDVAAAYDCRATRRLGQQVFPNVQVTQLHLSGQRACDRFALYLLQNRPWKSTLIIFVFVAETQARSRRDRKVLPQIQSK